MSGDRLVKGVNQRFLDFYSGRGYQTEISGSIIPEGKDAGVLFTICGGIKYDRVFRGIEGTNLERMARVQRCLRTDNDYRIGHSDKHLSSFDMVEAFNFGNSDFKRFLETAFLYLGAEGLPEEELFVNVPSGDSLVARIARDVLTGTSARINELSPEELVWAISDSASSGQRVEIGSLKTGYELWNISLINTSRGYCIDSGMASERLAATRESLTTLFELPELAFLTKAVENTFGLDLEDARYVADQVRSISRAISEECYPSSKGRGNKIRRMLKNTLVRTRTSGNSERLLDFFPESSREKMRGEVSRVEKRYLKLAESFRQHLRENAGGVFDLDAYLLELKGGRLFHDQPKLLNEEYVRIAVEEGLKVPLVFEVTEKEAGKKYSLPTTLVKKIKST